MLAGASEFLDNLLGKLARIDSRFPKKIKRVMENDRNDVKRKTVKCDKGKLIDKAKMETNTTYISSAEVDPNSMFMHHGN